MATTGIHVDNISKTYRSHVFSFFGAVKAPEMHALRNVSFRIEPGQAFGIIGPNGAGKTTLMSCLLGLLFPDSGGITIDGLSPGTIGVQKRIGYLPERLNFDRSMDAFQFMEFHHELANQPKSARKVEVEALLRKVELHEEAWRRPIGKFSRGMLQRLGLAQALIGKPGYLFLDEPTSGVDPAGVMHLRKLLLDAKKDGTTMIVNSHQLDEIERMCDSVAFIRGGTLEAIESLGENSEKARKLSLRFGQVPEQGVLEALSDGESVKFLDLQGAIARYDIANDRAAQSLLQSVVAKELPLLEATREDGRLEKLFIEGQQS